jgi:hypothetical protein
MHNRKHVIFDGFGGNLKQRIETNRKKKRQNGSKGSTKVLDEGTKHTGHATALHSSAVQQFTQRKEEIL